MNATDRIAQVLRNVTDSDVAELGPEVRLQTLEGWDSMRAVNFQLELEQEFGVDLSSAQITGNSTIDDVLGLLRERNAAL